jgi:hypothetical protein
MNSSKSGSGRRDCPRITAAIAGAFPPKVNSIDRKQLVYACACNANKTRVTIMHCGARITFMVHTILTALLLFGCGQNREKDALTQWPDGTNSRYDIEAKNGNAHDVLVPDVRFIQTNERFIMGRAYWRYMATYQPSPGPALVEFWRTPDGRLLTNEFWFALDRYKDIPKCYLLVTTNTASWIKWCNTNNVSTTLMEISQFRASTRRSGL